MEKVTLKSIAEQAGVSLTTVHRVLGGKGGASKAVEEKILRIAREQGYAINMAASNLRKNPLHIALVFPRMDKSAHYFINRILDGYLGFREFKLVNAFLVEGEEKAALIDTGCGIGHLAETVRELTDKPLVILITHGHFDHDGGIKQFPGVPVYLHSADGRLMHQTVAMLK